MQTATAEVTQRKLKLTKSFVKPLTLTPGADKPEMQQATGSYTRICLDTYRQCPSCSTFCV